MIQWSKLRFKPPVLIVPAIIYLLNSLVIQKIGLSADGAHYALYANHLSLGYVDHPPLIGWLLALMISLFPGQEWSLHAVPLVFSFLSLLVIDRLAGTLNLPKKYLILFCFISVVWNALTFLALTQAPLIFFCLLSCYAFHQWLQTTTYLRSISLGLSLGLAGLSDYSAFLVAFGFCLYLAFYQPKKLFSTQSLLTAFIAFMCVSPFLWWNTQHHWISFSAGYDHSLSGSFSWHWFLQAIILQFAGYSPALVIFGLMGALSALKHKHAKQSILAIPGLIVIILMNFSGMHHKIFFHWPALGYLLLAPLAYTTIIKHWSCVWTKIIVIFSILVSACVYLIFYLQIFFSPMTFSLGHNPLMDLYGWKTIGQEAKFLAEQHGEKKPILFVPNWSLASRLAWYSGLPVQILQPSPIAGYQQFVMWYGAPSHNTHGILVIPFKWPKPAVNSPCVLIHTMTISAHQKLINQVYFYQCHALPFV